MCGIFGTIRHTPIPIETAVLLAEANLHRGNRAFGYLHGYTKDNGVATAVFHTPTPYQRHHLQLDQHTLFLGHIRAPTSGRTNDVHPFSTQDLILAHNGLLLNHHQFPHWHQGGIDSHVIIGGIQHHIDQGQKPIPAIINTISQLEGQQACWLWHRLTNTLYLWRVMSPIYTSTAPGQFAFASVTTPHSQTLLDEGTLYQLNATDLTLTAVATFPFYSPYHLKK